MARNIYFLWFWVMILFSGDIVGYKLRITFLINFDIGFFQHNFRLDRFYDALKELIVIFVWKIYFEVNMSKSKGAKSRSSFKKN